MRGAAWRAEGRAWAQRTGGDAPRPCPSPAIYESRPAPRGARCGFRDFFTERTASRRDAYLSSTTHLPGCHLWHSSTGCCVRRPEDIHKTEAELEVELG
jgi:hypothetical protein